MDAEGDSIYDGSDVDVLSEAIIAQEIRLVLLGKTGSGKSHTGNTILGSNQAFKIAFTPYSCTQECQHSEEWRFGKNIRIVDSPGLMDTDRDEEDIKEEVVKCVANSAPGVHAFLVVIRADVKMTQEERDSLDLIQKYFGNDIFKYMIIVITHKDYIDKGVQFGQGKSFPQWLDDIRGPLQDVYRQCNGRAVAFNNEETNLSSKENQVKDLLAAVDKMVHDNGETYYTDENLQTAERMLRREVAKKLGELKIQYKEKQQAREKTMLSIESTLEREAKYEKQLLEDKRGLQKALKRETEQLALFKAKYESKLKEKKNKVMEYDRQLQEVLGEVWKAQKSREKIERQREEAIKNAKRMDREICEKLRKEEKKVVEDERERLRRLMEKTKKPSNCVML